MTPRTRHGENPPLSRRAALGLGLGAVAGVALAGCALNNPLTDEKTPAAEATRDLAPDVAVAVEAVTLVRGAQAAARSTAQRHTALAQGLTGLLAAHQAHLDALVHAVPEGVDTSAPGAAYVVPPGPKAALTGLAAAEQTLRDGLVGLAMRAQSGAFARLLGAMAASVSQQLRVLAR
jgi:hypothetical protein